MRSPRTVGGLSKDAIGLTAVAELSLLESSEGVSTGLAVTSTSVECQRCHGWGLVLQVVRVGVASAVGVLLALRHSCCNRRSNSSSKSASPSSSSVYEHFPRTFPRIFLPES